MTRMKSQSKFAKTIRLLRENKKDAGTMIILDFAFLLTLWYSSKLISLVVQQNLLAIQSFSSTAISAFGFMTVFTIMYALVIVAIYSGFKLLVVQTINHMVKKEHKLPYRRFCALNSILAGVLFLVYGAMIASIRWAIKFEYQQPWRNIATLMLVVIFYLIINVSTIFFAEGLQLKNIWRKTGRFLMQPRRYLPVFGFSALAFLSLYGVYYLSALLVATVAPLLYQKYIALFTWIIIAVFYLVVVWFNRLYFFVIEE